MKRNRPAIRGQRIELLRGIARRLCVYDENMQELDRDALEANLSGIISDLTADRVQRMLGAQKIRGLEGIAEACVKSRKTPLLEIRSPERIEYGIVTLYELSHMGLAVQISGVWHVDPLIMRFVVPISPEVKEALEKLDPFQDTLDRWLDSWGAIPYSELADLLAYNKIPVDESFADLVIDIMHLRHGQASIERWEDDFLIISDSAQLDEQFMADRNTELYRKLPFRFMEWLGDDAPSETSCLYGDVAYDIYMLVAPSKGMPDPEKLSPEEMKTACVERLIKSQKASRAFFLLSHADYHMRRGARDEAEKELTGLLQLVKTEEQKDAMYLLIQEFLDCCRQWRLKGWTAAEVAAFPRLADSMYLRMVGEDGKAPRFSDPCPCGSGKKFGLCHGRGD